VPLVDTLVRKEGYGDIPNFFKYRILEYRELMIEINDKNPGLVRSKSTVQRKRV